jgi:hypothetical protein
MPSRMIDYENLWASEKLAACESSMRVEYLWLYGCADANGSFELNLRGIHSKVSAIRPRLTLQRIERLFAEFERRGLLFTWRDNGKCYGHWTGSDRPGRLPKPSERHRYKKLAPDVPTEQFSAYVSRFARDPLATASPLGVGVGLGLDRGLEGDGIENGVGVGVGGGTTTPAAKTAAFVPPNSQIRESTEKHESTANPKAPFSEKKKSKGNFECQYCEEGFFSAREFQKHKCGAKTAGGWECRWCHETFKDVIEFKLHFFHCPQADRERNRGREL